MEAAGSLSARPIGAGMIRSEDLEPVHDGVGLIRGKLSAKLT
jgi:hypothetical protein